VGRTRRVRFLSVSLAVLGIQFGCAATAGAQAWVPPGGEGTVTFTYQNYYATGHFDRQGHENKNGATHTKAAIVELDYGVTDTVGLNVSLPFVASKYTGPRPSYFVGTHETFPGPLDDGSYHAAFQDLRVELRRVFSAGPVAITPFVGGLLPTHDYETVGEAVPGRHRREIQLGASAGIPLDPLLPGAYAHVRYSYAAAERLHGFPFTRSNIDLEGGYSLTSRVALRGSASWQIAHHGPALDELADDWTHHDRFIAPSFLNAGGGASVSVTRSAEVYALWVATISGRSGAHVARVLAVGMSWNFGGGLAGLGARASSSQRLNPIPGSFTAGLPRHLTR